MSAFDFKTEEDEPHTYLSTSCLHGYHDRCESKGAKCKFCEAKCICSCHLKKERRRE